jgi:tetratricopeptide (TPR) repeat protein
MISRTVLVAMSLAPACLFAQQAKRIGRVPEAQRQTFEKQAKVAVLAGVGHYPSRSGLSELRFPARDVDLLGAELEKQGYRVVALKEQEAVKGSIVQALKDAAGMVEKEQGTILFFFSGHGFSDKGKNYLATYEASLGDLAGSGLAVADVEQRLKASGAVRQVLFIDACRNEAGKSVSTRTFARFQAAAGLKELYATKMGEVSFEYDELQHGVFAHYLILGLQGQAAGTDGLVTFRDLADYVTESVKGFGFKKGRMQVPYEAGESSGDFLLASVSGAAPPVVVTPTPDPVRAPVPTTDLKGCDIGAIESRLETQPKNEGLLQKLASCSASAGQFAVAIGAYNALLEINGNNVAYLHARGQAKLANDSVEGAKQDFAAAAQKEPKNGSYWADLGRAELKLSNWQDAKRALYKAVTNGAETKANYLDLATAYDNAGNKDLAAEARNKASQLR